ncbi:hypothetical protein pdam_00017197 [Pocillopora damicornis]|uniref:Glycoprotein hormone subunit beta domain-containing protein n=2 Tax=Pocillopora TaxID=46730 RepID=A0A3M6U981_POCDA|nr:hypothetical protein pdam_00017197 [Pocillopora damicornis]CAH3124792.1 unnamed protein product [Pocillopora meandrina]
MNVQVKEDYSRSSRRFQLLNNWQIVSWPLKMLFSVTQVMVVVLLLAATTGKSTHRLQQPSDCRKSKGYLIMGKANCSFRITTFGCRGGCLSSAKPFSYGTGFASSCGCCAPIEDTIEEKTVTCWGERKVIRYPVAKRCACRTCN